MSRIVSVWLPRWPILRFLATQAKNLQASRLILTAVRSDHHRRRRPAHRRLERGGGGRGTHVPASRWPMRGRKRATLQARAVDAAADDTALRRLALWATRYTPTASPWSAENGADGFFLDIEGAAHLFGGEEKLLADLSAGSKKISACRRGLPSPTRPAPAWALSRFHAAPNCILPSGAKPKALAPLPIEALRLSPETRTTLRRLGFQNRRRAARQAARAVCRAFSGRAALPSRSGARPHRRAARPYRCAAGLSQLRYLLEPIITQEAVVALARRLMQTLVHVLTRDDVGARRYGFRSIASTARWNDRYRTDAADAQCLPRDAPSRSQARGAGRDAGCRLRLRGGRACRHPRRAMPARQTS
jgi:protein ImuB